MSEMDLYQKIRALVGSQVNLDVQPSLMDGSIRVRISYVGVYAVYHVAAYASPDVVEDDELLAHWCVKTLQTPLMKQVFGIK